MARNFGKILARIWNDKDFRALEPGPQRVYLMLLSQQNLNHAGVLPVTLKRWASTAKGVTIAHLEDDLDVLDRERFVVMDSDTEELLIRTFIRNDEVYKQPKVMLAATSAAQEIVSVRLRLALLAEIERLPLEELPDAPTKSGGPPARTVVARCVETLRRTLSVPGGNPTDPSPETLPERVPETLSDTPTEGFWEDIEPEFEDEPVDNYEPARQDPDGKGSGKGIGNPHTRAGAHSPAPTTSPFPEPFPPTADDEPPATGRILELVHNAPAAEITPHTTDQLVAVWLQNVKRPPNQVIARVGKEIKAMLGEGIDPVDVLEGLKVWARKGLDPATLPSVVNQVMNAQPAQHAAGQRPSTTDARVAQAKAAGREFAAQFRAQQEAG